MFGKDIRETFHGYHVIAPAFAYGSIILGSLNLLLQQISLQFQPASITDISLAPTWSYSRYIYFYRKYICSSNLLLYSYRWSSNLLLYSYIWSSNLLLQQICLQLQPVPIAGVTVAPTCSIADMSIAPTCSYSRFNCSSNLLLKD